MDFRVGGSPGVGFHGMVKRGGGGDKKEGKKSAKESHKGIVLLHHVVTFSGGR